MPENTTSHPTGHRCDCGEDFETAERPHEHPQEHVTRPRPVPVQCGCED